ncbi:MAG: T9SS type A sorting domain-containing protein, partial [candidate division WOR-3 bacterium]
STKSQILNNSELRNPKSEISLKIYDVSGRLVKSFNHLTNYQSSIIWSGADDLGRNLPAGVYLIEFESGNHAAMDQVILID